MTNALLLACISAGFAIALWLTERSMRTDAMRDRDHYRKLWRDAEKHVSNIISQIEAEAERIKRDDHG